MSAPVLVVMAFLAEGNVDEAFADVMVSAVEPIAIKGTGTVAAYPLDARSNGTIAEGLLYLDLTETAGAVRQAQDALPLGAREW